MRVRTFGLPTAVPFVVAIQAVDPIVAAQDGRNGSSVGAKERDRRRRTQSFRLGGRIPRRLCQSGRAPLLKTNLIRARKSTHGIRIRRPPDFRAGSRRGRRR